MKGSMSSIFRQFLDKGLRVSEKHNGSLNFESSKFEFFFPGCVFGTQPSCICVCVQATVSQPNLNPLYRNLLSFFEDKS